MDSLSKDSLSKIRILGIYQIVGGVIGLGVTIVGAIQSEHLSTLWFIFLIGILLFGYSIYCGNLLLEKKINGLKYSLIHQCLQLVHFFFFSFGFAYASGLTLSIGLNINDYNLLFNFTLSTLAINIDTTTTDTFLSLNLIPLFIILFIGKIKEEISKADKTVEAL